MAIPQRIEERAEGLTRFVLRTLARLAVARALLVAMPALAQQPGRDARLPTIGVAPPFSLTTADELEMRALIAHCHLGLGKLYHRTDKREQAREHLATAMTMYREMGMTYWLEKAEAELG